MQSFYDSEVISVYTRAQAIEDGILVPVQSATPFKHPVVFTSALWAEIVRGAGKTDPNVRNGRIWDACFMAVLAAKMRRVIGTQPDDADIFYRCKIGRKTFALWCNCGPDDEGAPCITVGFPEDR